MLAQHADKKSPRRLKSAEDLLRYNLISDSDVDAAAMVGGHYAIGVSPHLAGLIMSNPASNAIRAQYIPSAEELLTTQAEISDPIGDERYSPVKGIVHRYPDRVLLKAVSGCAVYCRYCFRREMIGPGSEGFTKNDLDNALDYIRSKPEIWEVILTGGDPLILSPRQMTEILDQLSAIEHVRVIRIHTRVPVADPVRITDALLSAFKNKGAKPLYIVLHVNHPEELTPEVKQAIRQLHQAGCTLLSQSVLLRNVNDDAAILEQLFRALIENNVKPYYLHHPDMAKGTAHFRLSLKEGMAIYRRLLGRVSGLCQPAYVLDIPGGYGKTPIHAGFVEELKPGHYQVEDYQGNKHFYKDDTGKIAVQTKT